MRRGLSAEQTIPHSFRLTNVGSRSREIEAPGVTEVWLRSLRRVSPGRRSFATQGFRRAGHCSCAPPTSVGKNHGFASEVAGAPEVPAGDGAPGTPLFAAAEDLTGGGEHGGVEGLALWEASEGEGESFADTVVGDGEDVGAAEAEDEEHLDGPDADAADLGEAFDNLLVGKAANLGEGGDGAVDGFGGEVAEGFGFGGGEATGAEHIVGSLEQVLGRRVEFAEGGEQTLEDRGRGFAVELLVDDGFEQRFERRVLALELQREGHALDELAKLRIGFG